MKNKLIFDLELKKIFDESNKTNLSYQEIIEKLNKVYSQKNEDSFNQKSFYQWIKHELDDHSSFGLLAFDFQSNMACINQKVHEILNIEKTNGTNYQTLKQFLKLVDKRSDFMVLLKNARDNKQKIAGDFKLNFFDQADYKWVSVEGKYDFDENDEPKSFFCSIIDITEKRKNDKFQKLINSVVTDAKHAIVITEAEPLDLPGPRMLYVNEAYTEMTGYTAEEAIGNSPRFMQGEETSEIALKELKQKLLKWEACKTEVINYRKNGEKFWVELDIKPIKKSNGYVTHWVSIQKDITSEKLAESKLIESENRYKSLLNDSVDLIQSIGLNGEILFVNQTWKNTLGYTDDEISNLNIFDVVAEESQPQCLAEFELIMKGESLYNIKATLTSKDGKNIYLVGNSVPRIVDGKITGTQGFFKDITKEVFADFKRSQIEDSLKKVQRNAQIAEFNFDFELNEFFCSENINEIYGIKTSIGKNLDNWFSMIHQNDREDVKNHFDFSIKQHLIFEKEFRIIREIDNEIRWIHCVAEFNFDEENNPLMFHGTLKDISNQKESDEKLVDVQNQINFIFNVLDEVFFKVDVQNQKILEVSENCETIFGFSQSDFYNDYLLPFKIVHPDDLNILEADRKDLHEGKSVFKEYRIIDLNGDLKWIESKSKPILNEKLELITINLIVRDITSRKQNEVILKDALNQLEDYKKAIDESAIVSVTDANGVITYVNNKFCEISQYSEVECMWKKHNIINSGYHSKEFFHEMWLTISSGKIWKGEVRNKAKDGSFYWVDSTIIPFMKDGQPYQYISIRYDITEKMNMSLEIEKQKTFYETILNEIPADVVVFDHNHKYLFINPNGVKDTELRSYLIGKDDYDYCRYKNRDLSIADERRKVFLSAIASKDGISFEEEVIDKNNISSYKLRKFYPLFDANNECQFVIGFGIDITELKQQEILISESLKEKEALLGEIHHRVKNNLAVIDGLLELKKFYEKEDSTISTLSEVQMRIKVIALVHEKLYQSDQFSNINLNDYLKEFTNYYKQIFNKSDGDKVDFVINVENVNFDISKSITFGLLLNEFISNSLKYAVINNSVTITIGLKEENDFVTLYYKDSGNGLPESVKNGENKGFGYKLINTFLKQLRGEKTNIDSPNFEVEIRFKLK